MECGVLCAVENGVTPGVVKGVLDIVCLIRCVVKVNVYDLFEIVWPAVYEYLKLGLLVVGEGSLVIGVAT